MWQVQSLEKRPAQTYAALLKLTLRIGADESRQAVPVYTIGAPHAPNTAPDWSAPSQPSPAPANPSLSVDKRSLKYHITVLYLQPRGNPLRGVISVPEPLVRLILIGHRQAWWMLRCELHS
jgi:hypothetical protein